VAIPPKTSGTVANYGGLLHHDCAPANTAFSGQHFACWLYLAPYNLLASGNEIQDLVALFSGYF
jgi:hypothetical protein